jgi:hypothetical protein
MSQEKKGNAVQFSLLTGPFVGLLRAAEIMRGVSVLSDATFAEVEQSERLFTQFDAAAKPFKQLLDIYVSQFFGIKRADHFLRIYGTNAIAADISTMNKTDSKLFEDVRKLSEEKRFFHWDLEFPEVFINLETASWSENPGFDAVIGNPPYDVLKRNSSDKVLSYFIDFLRNNGKFRQIISPLLNLFQFMFFQAINNSKLNSRIGVIVPLSILSDSTTTGLRKILLEKHKIVDIQAFPQKDDDNNRVFKEAKLSTVIIILATNSSTSLLPCVLHSGKDIDENSPKFNIRIDDIKKFDPSYLMIPLVSSDGMEILNKLYTNPKISAFANCIKVFVGEIDMTLDRDCVQEIESEHELIKGAYLQRYWQREQPKQGQREWINLDLFNQKYQKSSKLSLYLQERIAFQGITGIDDNRRIKTTLVSAGFFLANSLNYVQILEISQINKIFILALLNSNFIEWRFRITSSNNNVNNYEIESLPIPKINFTTNSDRRQQGLENLINLYQQYQTDHQLDPILTQCEQHLNQQPEEADIIHDFLAYLAEQMIQLNQQKQTEIKGFLKWLERFIGCPVDTLKNKSKIQNYLGDYTKQQTLDPALDFGGLITILNQNKKLIKIDPNSRKDQEPIENEYQTSLNTLLPIKTQLKNCDNLIDEIVYQLYGLTPEEKAIIENSLNK